VQGDERGAGEASVTGATEDLDIRDAAERWPVTSSATLCEARLVRLREDQVRMPEGEVVARDVLEHPGAVAVVALDADEQVLMIRQYRHPVGRLLWEIPAGLRDVAGEPLHETALRELVEETGYRAARWSVLADVFTSPGISTERVRLFLATDLTEIPESERSYVRQHEEAHLVLARVPLETAVTRVLTGDLHNGVTALGILSAYAAREDGFAMLRDADAPEH
jgi:8-oxo-dGDP phosphatase